MGSKPGLQIIELALGFVVDLVVVPFLYFDGLVGGTGRLINVFGSTRGHQPVFAALDNNERQGELTDVGYH